MLFSFSITCKMPTFNILIIKLILMNNLIHLTFSNTECESIILKEIFNDDFLSKNNLKLICRLQYAHSLSHNLMTVLNSERDNSLSKEHWPFIGLRAQLN